MQGTLFLSLVWKDSTCYKATKPHCTLNRIDGFPGGSLRLPAMHETRVRSLGWEDPLKKEMATHCSILAWRFPWTEEPGGLQSMGWQRVGHDRATEPTHRHRDLKLYV